jgi:hypothetical protein
MNEEKINTDEQDPTVLLEERADLVFGLPVDQREQHLRSVEGRDRDQVEDHQHDIDEDELLQDQADEGGFDLEVLVGEEVASRDRAADREDEVRDWPRGGHDRIAAATAFEVHGIHRGRLRPAEPEAPVDPMKLIARRTPPTGSKWTIGLSVSRPNIFAVASPSRNAARAWLNSWTGNAINSMIATTMMAAWTCGSWKKLNGAPGYGSRVS